jgi:hypothetical protein
VTWLRVVELVLDPIACHPEGTVVSISFTRLAHENAPVKPGVGNRTQEVPLKALTAMV